MAKKTPPKRRVQRPRRPSPNLVFEPWSRARQQSVIGGIAAMFVLVALTVWMSREPVDATPPLEPIDTAARRATLAESTAKSREGAFAKVVWGVAEDATSVRLGVAAPVSVPVVDGRAQASIGIPADEGGKRRYIVLTISVFAGERRLFGSTLNVRDAAGSTDAVTISFNADAVRAAGAGSEPLTVRVEGFDAAGHHPGSGQQAPDPVIGEARIVFASS